MGLCSVVGCRSSEKDPELSFHRVSKADLVKWSSIMENIGIELQLTHRKVTMCSNHFLYEDFIIAGRRKHLRFGAVPRFRAVSAAKSKRNIRRVNRKLDAPNSTVENMQNNQPASESSESISNQPPALHTIATANNIYFEKQTDAVWPLHTVVYVGRFV
ncbi:uncharacterized protein LOC128732682 [Sabethes cyaneus]|uniref:uncharacterized protein LOC128732682 n=1 Tax=Sabethes cyaneus TaxID=53552 RepID=UPI00237D3C9D|nr:uncharacterized protein LOC128732682 [Sabethes cyaneus]